jgi:hypothetical protein
MRVSGFRKNPHALAARQLQQFGGIMRRIATLMTVMFITHVAQAQTPSPPTPATSPAKPTPPTRPVDGPGAPPFTKVPSGNAPLAEGAFVIGPDYSPAPELTAKDGVPVGNVTQFTLESKDSKFYPGIARDVFGTPDPSNPKSLLVETHPKEYQRTITVYVPAQYRKGTKAPLIVTHDGPKLGEPDTTLPRILDNLIAQKRVPPLVAVMIQNGGGDAQGSERGLEYDTMSGKFRGIHRGGGAAGGGEEGAREPLAQGQGPRGDGLQLGRGRGIHHGLEPSRMVPARHQLLGHLREPAMAVQPRDTGRRLGIP